MALPAVLRLVVKSLDEGSIPHMLTGSVAAAYYAEPRATRDIDLVVEASHAQLAEVGRQLSEFGLYVSQEAIAEAVQHEGQFNVIDPETGWKVDLILRKSRPFSVAEFGRRRSATVLGLDVSLATPEDLVIAKLEWAKRGGSELQLRDVASVLEAHGQHLDREYVKRWVEDLELEEQWARVLGEVQDPGEPSA